MIYLITGVPGSGKTLYAVSTLVQKLAGEKLTDKAGQDIKRRVCVDGIPNLVMPHELMATRDNDFVTVTKKDDTPPVGNGLWNWWEWCKPGDVIVIDEIQRYWRPRGMGTKPPQEIQMLETHRHYGVDFVIITQNPMLIDQNVRRLVGRHQHIRRMFGMARAVIYDWDGCSVDVHRTASATITHWGYPKDAYKLYKSSELHTKQSQKIPPWVIVPILAVVGGLLVGPKAYAVLSGAVTGKGISQPALSAAPPASAPASVLAVAPVITASSPGQFGVPLPTVVNASEPAAIGGLLSPTAASGQPGAVVAGCIVVRDKCGCFGSDGSKMAPDVDICRPLLNSREPPASLQAVRDLAPLPLPDDSERAALQAAFSPTKPFVVPVEPIIFR
jgi:zona occludens toxin